MTEYDNWIGQIHAAPEDDTLRMVFADWLEEHEDPQLRLRGEFIRLQYAADPNIVPRSVKCTCPPKRDRVGNVIKRGGSPHQHEPFCDWRVRYEAVHRMSEILGLPNHRDKYVNNSIAWFTGQQFDHDRFRPTYRRGFVEEILWRESLLESEVPRAIDTVLRRVPTIRVMHVEEAPELRTSHVRQGTFEYPWSRPAAMGLQATSQTPGEYPIAEAMAASSIARGEYGQPTIRSVVTMPEAFMVLPGLLAAAGAAKFSRGAWVRATESPYSAENLDRILGATWPQITKFHYLWRAR